MKQKSLFLFIVFLSISPALYPQHSLLQEEFSNANFSTPQFLNTHVLNFFHHSCGGNLLDDGLAAGLGNLGYHLHSCIYTQYEYENVLTDYRHWYKRFQRELGIRSGSHYYVFEGPDQNLNPALGERIDDDYQDFMLNYYEFNAEIMDIIIFKSCYPNSAVSSYDTDYDGTSGNNGYGHVTAGTPHADDGVNNFTYLNSTSSVDDPYDDSIWSQGQWDGTESSLAQLKTAYRGMLSIFAAHPDILFIAMQAAPMVYLTNAQANNCREFARWLREDWLHQYDPSGTDQFQDYPHKNVVPFDFHNSIAWTGDDSRLDNEYFWFPQNGHPDNMLDNSNSSKIGRNAGSEDHPESWLNNRAATLFCGGTDNASAEHLHKTPETYQPWIHAVVNRWEVSQGPTAVNLVQLTAQYDASNGRVKLFWSLRSPDQYENFYVQRCSPMHPDWTNIACLEADTHENERLNYSFDDNTIIDDVYIYRLKLVQFTGSVSYSNEVQVNIGTPVDFILNQNYPNPFNHNTKITYSLSQPTSVSLIIYNLLGHEIMTFQRDLQSAGFHEIIWDGFDQTNTVVPNGVYLYKLRTGDQRSMIRKMTVLK